MRIYPKSLLLAFFFSIFLILPALCQTEEQHAPGVANYQIEVKLDTLKKELRGNETITFVNISTKSVDTLFLHLYPNAFRSETSLFMKESLFPDRIKKEGKYRGYMEIEKVELNSELDISDAKIIQETIMKLPLPKPLTPEDTVRVKMEFSVKLPEVLVRMGYSGKDYMIGQWFPKMAVLEQNGNWNAHQYHFNSEFFADFGSYHVSLTVPLKYVVGATGYLVEERENPDSTKTFNFQAEDVHDFVWVASPDYLVSKKMVDGIEVNFVFKPEHGKDVQRIMDEVEFALKYYNSIFGKYPYNKFTIADAKIGLGGGAMEYPMLVTMVPSNFPPEKIKLDVMVLFHEIAHQWWYGMVASNEFEEAWLDEGFATYSEARALEQRFGLKANLINLWGIDLSEGNFTKLSYLLDPQSDPVVKNSWEFMDYMSYRANVYSKASLLLETLRNCLGEETMDELLKEYFRNYKFKHPRTRDFIQLACKMTGEDLNPLFEQVLFGTGVCDYEVASVKSEPVKSDSAKGQFKTEIKLKRSGEIVIPVDVLIKFENGEIIKQIWDGKERWHKIELVSDSKIESAVIDPEDKVALDININNNSLTTRAEDSAILKLSTQCFFWFETLIHLITSF